MNNVSNVGDVDKVEMVFKTIDKTEMYWNYFALYTASLSMWFINGDVVYLGIGFKITLLCLYAGFAYIHAKAHIRSYRFLEMFLDEVRPDIDAIFRNKRSRKMVRKLSYKQKPILVIGVYSFTVIMNGVLLLKSGQL
jgi:hypothetical protein